MKDTFLISTPKSEMHGLSRQGIGASKSFIQLRDIVRSKLGEEHAQLFAEPVENRGQHVIDWYTPLQGPVRRLLDLPPEEQRPYRERVRATARAIAVCADELAQSPENARQLRGSILELALCCPGEDALLLVGDRPVCVNWGYGPGTPGQAPLHLCELSLSPAAVVPEPEQKPKPVVPPPEPKQRRRPNWWWLLPAALACVALCLALFDLLFDMSKLNFPEPADVARMRRDNDELERRLPGMKQRVDELAKRCDPCANDLGMEFVLIEPGAFMMGDSGAGPQHRVTLTRSFCLGKYEVTQGEWEKVMKNNPSRRKDAKHPVNNMSWNEVQTFIKQLNAKEGHNRYRLPTEAEWEYAARAGTRSTYFFGEDKSKLDDYAWHSGNSGGKTHPVGQKRPSPWGLYDIHGNVDEMVADWYAPYAAAPVQDPTGPLSGKKHIYRGGCLMDSWSSSRPAHRHTFSTGNAGYLGFRLALTPAE